LDRNRFITRALAEVEHDGVAVGRGARDRLGADRAARPLWVSTTTGCPRIEYPCATSLAMMSAPPATYDRTIGRKGYG